MANRSTVFQDYETMFVNMAQGHITKEFLELFQNKEFMEIMESYEKALLASKQRLENSFNNLKQAMQYSWMTKDSDSILSQLITLSESIDYAEFQTDAYKATHNFAKDLLNQSTNIHFSDYDTKQQEAIQTFLANYVSMRNITAQAQNFIGSTGEFARQDKGFYGILISGIEQTDGLSTQKIDKMLLITRKQFEQFEKENKDLFQFEFSTPSVINKGMQGAARYGGTEGRLGSYRLKEGLDNTQLYKRLSNYAMKQDNQVLDVLDSSYFGLKTQQGNNLTFRDIFNILQNPNEVNIPLFNSPTNSRGQVRQMPISRRLELLFDDTFRSQIRTVLMNSDTSIDSTVLSQITNQMFPQGYQQESIYGGATGDKNFFIPGFGQIGLQLKYKNATKPWNGMSVTGLASAFHSFSTIASKLNENNITSSTLDRFYEVMGEEGFQQHIMNIFENDPIIQANLSEFAYSIVDETFAGYNWG